MENKFNAPMSWIGLYVAAASLICLLALTADTFRGFKKKSFWFPCKIFTLNAATLTLLGVVMKLPLDLSALRGNTMDAKLSSMVFMCVAMANFMPSLGAMGDKEILMNLVALAILVITILVNVAIQLGTGALFNSYIVCVPFMISMFLLLVISSVTALTVPTLRMILERKYCEILKESSREELELNGMVVEKLRENVTKYWMMSKTGSLEFYITRLATCYASGAICFLVATAHILVLEIFLGHLSFYSPSDQYKWSSFVIEVIQCVGVIMGSIAPVSRWLTATLPNCSKDRGNLSRDVFKVERYWIQRLSDWKWSPLTLEIRNPNFRKLVQTTKFLILDLCIALQKAIVIASKAVRHSSIFFVGPLISSCCCCCKRKNNPSDNRGLEADDIARYVLQLDGEEKLSEKNIEEHL